MTHENETERRCFSFTKTETGTLQVAVNRFPDVCKLCGTEISAFLGHRHCDACIEEHEKALTEEEDKKRVQSLVEAGAIKPRTINATFQNSDEIAESKNQRAYQIAGGWDYRDKKNIWICGPKGVGKSYLARCVVNKAIQKGATARECTAFEFERNCFKHFKDRHPWEIYYYDNILLIDDIDKAPWNDISLSALWQVLNERNETKKSTIVTCQFHGSQLAQLWHDRFGKNTATPGAAIDRMKPCISIEMFGNSLR